MENLNRRSLGPQSKRSSADIIEDNNYQERIKITNFSEQLRETANYTGMDICFVIDATASMGPYIEGAKESLRTIIEDAKQSLIELSAPENSLKFSVIAYRDHPPQDKTFVTSICNFTSPAEAEIFLSGINAQGGGDISEAVIDALNDSLTNISWRDESEKFLFLVADAPPHGKIYDSGSDAFPEGCPCGLKETDVLPKLRDLQLDFTIIKVSSQIDKMIEIFSQYINIDVFQPKLFKQKNILTPKEYTKSVRVSMKSCMNSKVVSNLSKYTSSEK
jgi:hypothetical protein